MREYNIVERFSAAQKQSSAARNQNQEERKQSDNTENAQEERKESGILMQNRKSINAKKGSIAEASQTKHQRVSSTSQKYSTEQNHRSQLSS